MSEAFKTLFTGIMFLVITYCKQLMHSFRCCETAGRCCHPNLDMGSAKYACILLLHVCRKDKVMPDLSFPIYRIAGNLQGLSVKISRYKISLMDVPESRMCV